MHRLIEQTSPDFIEEGFTKTAAVLDAVEVLAAHSSPNARGAIYTRVEVVDFILDLVGYTVDRPLHDQRLLEPSFGRGDFLLRAIGRLISAWQRHTGNASAIVGELGNSIRAVELHRETFESTKETVIELLKSKGISSQNAAALSECWLVQSDFLLHPFGGEFDFVVGNPPYVRQELIPAALLVEYRNRYQTLYDRADLYIPFIERSLRLLAKGGMLSYICADRWMKNRYGGPLRKLVADEFHLKVYVDMVDTPAFYSDVSAYPAITVIGRELPSVTRIARRPAINGVALSALAEKLRANPLCKDDEVVRELACVTNGREPWLLESAEQVALIRRIEREFPTIEGAGCKIGIGVATGADKAFIGDFKTLAVEPSRKLPLVTTRDIRSGEIRWRGLGVVNPFSDDGDLVELSRYPLLATYLEARRALITGRHCAQKSPGNWYRTIDRISPALVETPKLLMPDIKGGTHVVFEPGTLYPHHNLYYATSEAWDLLALQAVLLSSIARLFVATYSTKMRGGYLRFQAQYLRRIRIPFWHVVSEDLRQELIGAAKKRDTRACTEATCKLYNLSHEERFALAATGEEGWRLI